MELTANTTTTMAVAPCIVVVTGKKERTLALLAMHHLLYFFFFFLSPKTSSRGEQYVRGPLVNSLGFFFSEPPDEIKNCNLHPLPTPYPSNSDSSMDKIKYFLSGGRSSSVSVCQMKFVHENLTNAWSSAKTRKPPATVCRVWEVVFAMAALSNYPDPEWVVLAWTWTPPLASLW